MAFSTEARSHRSPVTNSRGRRAIRAAEAVEWINARGWKPARNDITSHKRLPMKPVAPVINTRGIDVLMAEFRCQPTSASVSCEEEDAGVSDGIAVRSRSRGENTQGSS